MLAAIVDIDGVKCALSCLLPARCDDPDSHHCITLCVSAKSVGGNTATHEILSQL